MPGENDKKAKIQISKLFFHYLLLPSLAWLATRHEDLRERNLKQQGEDCDITNMTDDFGCHVQSVNHTPVVSCDDIVLLFFFSDKSGRCELFPFPMYL